MKVLITGGLGFLGSKLVTEYIEQNVHVIIIDNESTSCIKASAFNSSLVDFHKMDLAELSNHDVEVLKEKIQECDFIYHFASAVGVKYINDNPKVAIQKMYKSNLNFFEILKAFKKPVIFASTSEVYGDNPNAKESDDLHVKNPVYLRGGYASAKIMAEYLIQTYDFPFLILRFFNVTGMGQLPDYGMVLPKFIQMAKEGKPLTVFNDGSQIRSFCDVRDAINAIFTLVHKKKIFNEVFNIGNSQNTVTIKDLAKKVVDLSKSQSSITFQDFNQYYQKYTHEITIRAVNDDKIRQYYQPQYGIDDIIQSFMGKSQKNE